MGRIRVLVPTPPVAADLASPAPVLAGRVGGLKVGLRLDRSWRSYFAVVDVWEQRLREDGAEPVRWLAGDRAGPGAEQTRTDLDEWSRLVDCGVVGLGN